MSISESAIAGDAIAGGDDGAAPPPPTRSITLQLVSPDGAARASLTGLKWAFFDSAAFPGLLAAGPVDSGSAETTAADGSITIDLPNTTLTAGQTGWLIITTSDGTATQNPPCMSFCAPVVVA